MPRCAIGQACLFPEVPLEGRHFCAICKQQLHGCCSIFNGDEGNTTYRNRCHLCPTPSTVANSAATTAAATRTPESANTISITQQSAPVMTAKDIDMKAVSWGNIEVGDRPSNKADDCGQMVKSVLTICGFDAMALNTEQLRQICSTLKIQGYHSKPKAEVLRIMAVAKLHQSFYDGEQEPQDKSPARTRNCTFWLLNVLFSDEMSPKVEQLGARKKKEILDSGLAANDEYFWQEVMEKYQEVNEEYDEPAHTDSMFAGIDPLVKLPHSWSKLWDIYKGVTKSYAEVFENFKKSGNHDDFINFCGAKSEVYYLYLWLQEKPQLEQMVVAELPNDLFIDSAKKEQFELKRRPSPTGSELSFSRSSGNKSSVAASINALVEERRKSREPSQFDEAISKQKLEMKLSRNYEENVKRLIDVKRQLETESNVGIIKVLKKYEKKLTKVVDFSSSSDESD
jgi:hypothetical protein